MYADVVFPFKLSPLTYKVPEDAPDNLKGRIVKAPLMGKGHYGLIVSARNESLLEKKKNIKMIQEIHHHFASESTLSFMKWLSDYYLSPMGIALKSIFFEEAVNICVKHDVSCIESQRGTKKVANFQHSYKSFLYHAPSISHEYYLLDEVLNRTYPDIHGAVILVPEVSQIENLHDMLKNIFGERLCVIHSKLTKNKRLETIKQIITGQSDIILGTRSAILVPISNISFIAVTSEHSTSYKGEEGLRYNARDAAVMRGFIEKSHVFLSSVCPSVESIYNVKTGKYSPTAPSHIAPQKVENRPKIKIIDSRLKGQKTMTISRDVIKQARDIASKGGRFLFIINTRGYSLIRCEDCGHIAQCNKCNIPLVFYKNRNIVKCHYCGFEQTVHESCEECKGFNIKPFGAGIEKIKEEIEDVLKIKTITLGKDYMPWVIDKDIDAASFAIGTSYTAKKLRDEKFDAIALFNTDWLFTRPDFRAYERTFQEITMLTNILKPDGSLYLQTWYPKKRILRFIKNYDFKTFYEYELLQRKILDYPPFSRIILFNIFMKKDAERSLHDIDEIINNIDKQGLEILGPVDIASPLKSYKYCLQIFMKSKGRKILHSQAERLLIELKKIKGAKINADVDPLKI
ncbi:primosomal protein N' [hot springs metagenome]|uniref:Primosomal protein N n=1 Tax=hot springs metagenome TaxID=433727 RepID=A0A5J4L5U5_9ZZZZ